MKIKAAVLYEHNTPLVVEEIEIAEPKAGEVLVKIEAAVCTARQQDGVAPHDGKVKRVGRIWTRVVISAHSESGPGQVEEAPTRIIIAECIFIPVRVSGIGTVTL